MNRPVKYFPNQVWQDSRRRRYMIVSMDNQLTFIHGPDDVRITHPSLNVSPPKSHKFVGLFDFTKTELRSN